MLCDGENAKMVTIKCRLWYRYNGKKTWGLIFYNVKSMGHNILCHNGKSLLISVHVTFKAIFLVDILIGILCYIVMILVIFAFKFLWKINNCLWNLY